jgi:large subunit ribosomal protein L6
MIDGVTTGYSKQLEIVGIGYRAEMQGQELVLSVGYSHKIKFLPPQGISIKVDEQTNITVAGSDKQLVGESAAKIRAFRKPEPYKGKGIRYKGEKIKKKSTKTAK